MTQAKEILCFKVVITHIQRSIDTENVEDDSETDELEHRFIDQCQQSTGFSFRKFQREANIKSYFKCLAGRHTDKAQYIKIGNSYEGRDLFLIKIGTPSRGIRKPAVWIDGGIHAREWISPATVSYFAYELLENAGNNEYLLDQYDFYVMPIVNPDGYEYTHTNDRYVLFVLAILLIDF